MLQIDLVNIQAIGEAHISVEDNSICEFTGDNSNGKSVVSKVIEKLVSGDLKERSVRDSLIKDNTEQGVVLFTYNNKQLGIMLQREIKVGYNKATQIIQWMEKNGYISKANNAKNRKRA